jgi:hypothetical protein
MWQSGQKSECEEPSTDWDMPKTDEKTEQIAFVVPPRTALEGVGCLS